MLYYHISCSNAFYYLVPLKLTIFMVCYFYHKSLKVTAILEYIKPVKGCGRHNATIPISSVVICSSNQISKRCDVQVLDICWEFINIL